MSDIFLATLGQRPEAITVALDLLRERYPIQQAGILHTEPYYSGIAESLANLKPILDNDYGGLPVRYHELTGLDGGVIMDISTQNTAEGYYNSLYDILVTYKQKGDCLHLLVAGGRKAMSIYATLAAGLVFRGRDRVWTVLSPEALLRPGLFHIPPGWREQVQLVALPLITARVVDGVSRTPANIVTRRQNIYHDFYQRLSKQERILVDMLQQHPYAGDNDLAELLHKSPRTIQNQLRSIYQKMTGFFDFGERITDKRRLLIDLILGRLD